ncbi:uncharacterized protein LOC114323581 [Camellia sinensis]|uniref:uncharacterized protein LOC114323581 n=1 Tax=Camellia sinensis TaxID=4442 RepID=UPI0010361392|nr:uncharacterized protein LOC114323581 [Camellia sinensis]
MELLMQRINEHIRVEDDATASTAKTNQVATDKRVAGKVHAVGQETNHPHDCARESDCGPNCRNRGKSRRNDRTDYPCDEAADAHRKLNARTGITTIFKISIYRILSEIRNEVYVRFPAKLGDGQKGFNPWYCCTFHKEQGHRTDDCLPLKQHLEVLVAAGHLDRYIDGGIKWFGQPRGTPPRSGQRDPQYSRAGTGMRAPMDDQKSGTYEGSFVSPTSDQERDFDVKHILIDQGSSVEIIYYDAFKQLKLRDTDLVPATSPLVGFNSQPEWPMRKIILSVKAESIVKQVEFWVLKVPSTYNLTLGRGLFHAMQAVASTYHQVMRFSSATGEVEETWGDQVMAK